MQYLIHVFYLLGQLSEPEDCGARHWPYARIAFFVAVGATEVRNFYLGDRIVTLDIGVMDNRSEDLQFSVSQAINPRLRELNMSFCPCVM